MQETETEARVRLVARALKAYGISDADRIEAVVDCTLGIPWLVPPIRGEENEPRLLFAEAVAGAALSSEFGAPDPANILSEAIKIGGRLQSHQGGMADRRWVAAARRGLMGVEAEKLLQIGEGDFGEVRAITGSRKAITDGGRDGD